MCVLREEPSQNKSFSRDNRTIDQCPAALVNRLHIHDSTPPHKFLTSSQVRVQRNLVDQGKE